MSEKESHPKKQVLYKFLLLCMLLGGYFVYLSIEYNLKTGGIADLSSEGGGIADLSSEGGRDCRFKL